MRTDGLILADAALMRDLEGDQALQQVANVAHLPGIVGPAIAMPDIHWGYGFPIGGVAAFDEDEGVVSPGGVGYDINCGVRLLATPLAIGDVRPRLRELVDGLYRTIPSGVGASRSDLRLERRDLERADRRSRGRALLGSDERRRELRLRQPPAHGALRAAGPPPGVRRRRGGPHPPRVRRVSQHRQTRDPRGRWPAAAVVRPPQRRHPSVPTRPCRALPDVP